MGNREQSWGFDGRGRHEGGSFDDGGREEGGERWRGEGRYGALHDQERVGYGGQEYGLEGGPSHRTTSELDPAWRGDEREVWRPGDGAPYGDLEFDPRSRGIQEFGPPADYAYHPPAGHEFDPDYLQWREARMRAHDRGYREWRARRQQRYDEDYRRLRNRRR